jgi:hypothetical protein
MISSVKGGFDSPADFWRKLSRCPIVRDAPFCSSHSKEIWFFRVVCPVFRSIWFRCSDAMIRCPSETRLSTTQGCGGSGEAQAGLKAGRYDSADAQTGFAEAGQGPRPPHTTAAAPIAQRNVPIALLSSRRKISAIASFMASSALCSFDAPSMKIPNVYLRGMGMP